MFFHLYKYSLKALIHNRNIMFWVLIFPVILASFMYFAFGSQMDTMDDFYVIPVAIVEEKASEIYEPMLKYVSDPEKDPLIQAEWVKQRQAEKLFQQGKVDAIIYVKDNLSMTVAESGMEQAILANMLDSFEQYKQIALPMIQSNPEKKEEIVASFLDNTDDLEEYLISDVKANPAMNFFYAVIAFACLFASLEGCDRSLKLQSEDNVVAQRRGVSAVSRRKMLLADFLACVTIQYVIVCLLFLYMRVCLRLNFGDKYPAILLLLLIGSSCGIVLGIVIGALRGINMGMKIAIMTSINLVCCMMSDLMIEGIKDWIWHHAAWLNRINPAALLSDAFYVLKVYDGYERFVQDVLLLGVITLVLMLISLLLIKEE